MRRLMILSDGARLANAVLWMLRPVLTYGAMLPLAADEDSEVVRDETIEVETADFTSEDGSDAAPPWSV